MEETNFEDLARCLEAGLLNGNLSAEPPATLTLNNLLQFAQLSQLGLQWLCSLREQDEDKERKLQVATASCLRQQAGRLLPLTSRMVQALTRHAHKYREDFKALAEDHKRVKAREASTQATLAEARAEQQRLQQQLEQVQQQLGQVQHKLAQQSPGEEEVLPPTQPVQPSGPSVEVSHWLASMCGGSFPLLMLCRQDPDTACALCSPTCSTRALWPTSWTSWSSPC